MSKVVVIGGANLDLIVKPNQDIVFFDSNPSKITTSHGGVGRNIAENLALLGLDVTLIAPIGNDFAGKEIIDYANSIHLTVLPINVSETTKYIAVMDKENDLYIGLSGMSIFETLNKEALEPYLSAIQSANLLIIDTNLTEELIEYILDHSKCPVYVDAISTNKAVKLKTFLHRLTGIKMNRYEAQTLSNINYNNAADLESISKFFENHGIKNTLITLGKEGSLLINNGKIIRKESLISDVLNVTGAGDAFFAGFIYGLMRDKNPLHVANIMAKITLNDYETVSKKISEEYIERLLKEIYDE